MTEYVGNISSDNCAILVNYSVGGYSEDQIKEDTKLHSSEGELFSVDIS